MKWVRSGEYDRIMSGEYRKRADEGQSRATRPATPTDYYGERFRAIFREVGEGVYKTGDKVGDAADKLSDWLKQR